MAFFAKLTQEKPPGSRLPEGQPLQRDAPAPLLRGPRFSRPGFILGRVLLALFLFAAVVILAPFIYSIWMVISYSR